MNRKFYFDTYAIIEIGKGNKKYDPYTTNVQMILNRLNLLELAYFLLREGREEEIQEMFDKYSNFHVDYEDQELILAAIMKFKLKKQQISFIDCIGYILAKKHHAKFLTGDEHFRRMENVEFVK